ncbi:hypothetical protein D3C74_351220 [compost metagenome]
MIQKLVTTSQCDAQFTKLYDNSLRIINPFSSFFIANTFYVQFKLIWKICSCKCNFLVAAFPDSKRCAELKRCRKNIPAVIIDMLTDQVYAAGSVKDSYRLAALAIMFNEQFLHFLSFHEYTPHHYGIL